MRFRVCVQSREDEGEDDGDVISHEVDDVFVVPVVQRSLSDLGRSGEVKST